PTGRSSLPGQLSRVSSEHRSTRSSPPTRPALTQRQPFDTSHLELHASTDAVDTDFVAVLCDVHPDGFVQNLAEGLVRGRFRDSYDDPTLLTPGQVYRLTIE
ncbi:hypothetical protein EEB14_62915, partial [Rhodococcus sp. WS4]